jgi:hypothetical protein
VFPLAWVHRVCQQQEFSLQGGATQAWFSLSVFKKLNFSVEKREN